jgi:hypothetical protein
MFFSFSRSRLVLDEGASTVPRSGRAACPTDLQHLLELSAQLDLLPELRMFRVLMRQSA